MIWQTAKTREESLQNDKQILNKNIILLSHDATRMIITFSHNYLTMMRLRFSMQIDP